MQMHRCPCVTRHVEEAGMKCRVHQRAPWSDGQSRGAVGWPSPPCGAHVPGPQPWGPEERAWSRSSSFSDGHLNGHPEKPNWEICRGCGGSMNVRTPAVGKRALCEEDCKCLSCLQHTLQDTITWLSSKEEELAYPWPLGSDVAALQRQTEGHQLFVEEVKSRGPGICSVLRSTQDVLSQCSMLDSEETFDNYEGVSERRGAQQLWQQSEVVGALWEQVMEQCSARERRLEAALAKMEDLQASISALALELEEALGVQEAWGPLGELLVDALQDHINAIRLFEEELEPLGGRLRRTSKQAQQLRALGVQLSPEHSQALQHISNQWRLLQDSIEVRLRDLQDAHRSFGPQSQQFLLGSVQRPWERAISRNRVPYYINHKAQTTSWDHPQMTELYQAMANLNHIRFSAYRTALKLRRVQKALRLDRMKLSTVAAICPKSELQDLVIQVTGSAEVTGSEVMDVLEVIHALGALYKQQEEEGSQQLNIPLCVDMCLNWLLNVYDSGRLGRLRVLSFKTGLVCLCDADTKEKCQYLFQQVCGGDGRSEAAHLAALLTELMLIPRQLGEVAAFGGSNVEPSVASCFRMVSGKASVGLCDFLEWMGLEPQSVVWLPLLHRVSQAEGALHQARCSVCKQSPIRGFRYRSLKQFNVDICQSCFLSGQALKGKTLHYPIIEYYTPSTSGEKMRDFAETLKNKFRSKQYFSRHPQRGYLPVQSAVWSEKESTPVSSPKLPLADTHSRIEHFASRLAQMENQNCSFFNHSLDEDQYPLGSGSEMEQHHLLSDTGRESQEELQQTLAILEDQNRILQREYRRLRWQHAEVAQAAPHSGGGESSSGSGGSPGGSSGGQEEVLLAEARVLRHHRGRLETRMQILEEHNRQLESQLHRLRTLLLKPRDDSEDSASSDCQSAVHSPSLRRERPGTRPGTAAAAAGGTLAEHDRQRTDTTCNLQQVIEQLRTVFPPESDSPTPL